MKPNHDNSAQVKNSKDSLVDEFAEPDVAHPAVEASHA